VTPEPLATSLTNGGDSSLSDAEFDALAGDAAPDAGCVADGCSPWIWAGGSSVTNQGGVYGTLGSPAPTNVPGARYGAVAWTDAAGKFWLFGGAGDDSQATLGELNDLWKYASGEWTWVSGANVIQQAGIYGTQGTPSASNAPGGRQWATASRDAAGNVWLFGNVAIDSASQSGDLNDLWKY